MPPKKKVKEIDETPPDSPGTTYDRVIYICLKDAEPCMWLNADHVFANEQTVSQITGINVTKKLTLQHRAKINNFLLDETEPTKAMSIFNRIETGTDHKRVTDLLANLNARFKGLTYPQKSALKAMLIKNYGEKMMRNWSYEERDPITSKITYTRWGEVATRSKRTDKLPVTTGDEDDSEGEFQPSSSKKASKKVISSSSEGNPSPSPTSARTSSEGGSFLSNPFFTPVAGSSRTLGLAGKKVAPTASTSKGAAATVASKEKPPPKVVSASDKKTPRKRIVEETSSESDSDTLTRESSPAKKLALETAASTSGMQPTVALEPLPPGLAQLPGAGVVSEGTYDVPVARLDEVPTYTEAILISEQQLDEKMRGFLTDFERNRAQSEPFKAVVKAAVEEVMDPKLELLRNSLQELMLSEFKKVVDILATKATKSSTSRIMEAIAATNTTIEDFSIEQARIRCEIGNITEHAAEKTSRACGILGRFLPFDIMGVGFDLFLSSHYVQGKIMDLIKDEFDSTKGTVNFRIAFAITSVLTTRVAMAHLVWRHPKNQKKALYYKRKVPDALQKIIKTLVIPYVRANLQLGGETFVGSFEGVRKVMARRFANARTKLLEVAFGNSANPDSAMEALHNLDNEFYVHNVHAIPATAVMEDRTEYRQNLTAARAECSTGEDREGAGKPFQTEESLFDSLRNGCNTKHFSMYEVMQGIIAAAKADGQDVTKMTFDQPIDCPDFVDVYKKVLNDNIANLEALMNKFPVNVNAQKRTRSDSEAEEEEQLKNLSLGSADESDNVEEEQGEEEEVAQHGEDEPDDESPSELDRNVITISSDEEQQCHTQLPQPQSAPLPEIAESNAPATERVFSGTSRFTNPIVVTPGTSSQTSSQPSSQATPRPYDEHGRPQPLPPLPDNPFARPDPFANLSYEELAARIQAAQAKMANLNRKPEMK